MASETLKVDVEGMTCGHCARTVERALLGVDGVVAARVDLAAKGATVVAEGGRADRAALVAAVRAAGYGVED